MENLLQLIISDQILALELVALFAIGFYLIAVISAYPERVFSHKYGSKTSFARNLKTTNTKAKNIQIGFSLATLVGVGAVLSPARTWLRQDL